MARLQLHGAQRMVLQAVNDLPKNAAGFVTDELKLPEAPESP